MGKIFAFQPDLCAPALREPQRVGQGRRAAYPGFQLLLVFGLEVAGVQMLSDAFFEPLQRGNEGFGHVAAAEGAEAAPGIREFAGDGIGEQVLGVECGGCHLFTSLGQQSARLKRSARFRPDF